jgi:beta-lactam-binding protein with PASTA domain/serine/threonine protein kinase
MPGGGRGMTSETRSGRGAPLVGAFLEGRYRVDSLIARGGMSAVYRGLDTRLDRPVALKVMDSRYSGDRSFIDRFEREARAAARLHHPHVVAVYDQGVDQEQGNDHIYLVMQLIEGCTLRDLLRDQGTLPPALAFSVMEPMLSALAAAHQAGMVHRDIKPENVLIGLDGSVKVADFGLVRAAASAGTTSGSVILGTVAYLSPEQVTTGAADARTDVYAAGVVLYEMLTGQPPYVADTALSVAYRHVNDDVPAPGAQVPELPPAIDDLVLRATRRDPSARPGDAATFLAELERVRTHLGLQPVPVPVPASEQRTAQMAAEAAGPPTDQIAPVEPRGTSGPQGTRAMPRSTLEDRRAREPVGPFPAQPERRRGCGRFVGWVLTVLVLAGLLVGGAAWWLGQGRYINVPTVDGRSEAIASKTLQDAHLIPTIARQYHDSVPEGIVISSSPAQGSRVLTGRQVQLVVSLGRPQVPAISAGTTVEDAERALQDAQLQPQLNPSADQYHPSIPQGKVIAVTPAPGTRVPSKTPVTLIVSKGPQPVQIPDVRGMPRDAAFAALTNAGFAPYDEGSQFAADVDGGHVISTDPGAGTTVPLTGTPRVGVVVSNAVTVPEFSGMRVQQAQQTASSLGLNLDVQSFFQRPNSMVFGQFPTAGTRVQQGSVIHTTAF